MKTSEDVSGKAGDGVSDTDDKKSGGNYSSLLRFVPLSRWYISSYYPA